MDELRAEFEAWANTRPLFGEWNEIEQVYDDRFKQGAWLGYQARAAPRPTQPAPGTQQGEVVVYTAINHERDPHCCGCWNIHQHEVVCNECGERRQLSAIFSSTASLHQAGFANVDELLAAYRKVEADARRYQWLKARYVGLDGAWNSPPLYVSVFEMPDDFRASADLDASIDAAMTQAGEKEGM